MERNPLFTKERASFYYEKIEYFYKNKAYFQALSEIEKNKDLLGAVLNVGKQLSLNKILANCIVNVMLDTFEYDGDSVRFDEYFTKYRTTLELHTSQDMYSQLQTYFSEKNKSSHFNSRTEKFSVNIEDTFGEYIEKEEPIVPIVTYIKQKDDKAKSIEEDFLNSIGKPLIISPDLKSEIKADEKELYGSKDEFESFIEPNIDLSHTMVFNSELMQKNKKTLEKDTLSNKIDLDDDFKMNDNNIKSSKKEISSDNSFDYTKSSAKNKSGGKVTELSFDSFNNLKTENDVIQENKSKKTQPNVDIKKKSIKKKKKKKKSILPTILILFLLIVAFSSIGIIVVKSDFLPNIKLYFEEITSQKTTEHIDEQEDSQIDSTENPIESPSEDQINTSSETKDTEILSEPEYILPSDSKSLTNEDLEGMDKSELRYAVNEMYARKGWHFNYGGDLYDYFSKKSWYKPDDSLNAPSDASAKFTDMENLNLATILKYRNSLS